MNDIAIYIMSDLHGQYVLFKKMLKQINFSSEDTLYILGDVCDRGKKPMSIYKHIIKTSNIHLLKGNHEAMFLNYLICLESKWINERDLFEVKDHYYRNGGLPTIEDFKRLDESEAMDILDFIQDLPYYKIIDNYILVHAGVLSENYNGEPIEEYLEKQDPNDFLGLKRGFRETFIKDSGIPGFTIIFGHTITKNMHTKTINKRNAIWHGTNKIGIDCGAFTNQGQLACIRLDDLKEFYQQ